MGVVYGIQTTVLADLKQLEEGTVPRISNKGKDKNWFSNEWNVVIATTIIFYIFKKLPLK